IRIPMEEVFEELKCTKQGLTSDEASYRLDLFGPNKLEEKKKSKIIKFLGFMWNPLSWVMEAAALMAIALANGGGRPPDWEDFVGIVGLLFINSTISFIEENNAGNAAAALMAGLARRTKILNLCSCKEDVKRKAHGVIDKFAERGLRSLAVARQEVPEKKKDASGGPWELVGLLPLFDPPRHDSAETIRRALNLGVNVKMITGDQLAIGKETGRRLGMGTNMYPSSTLLGQEKDSSLGALPVDELIEKADGFAEVFPEHKYEIVSRLQQRNHICGMTGDGVNDTSALKKADIGIAVAGATDAARGASDIVLTEPGLSVIISAVLTSRAIFQRMKNYTIYAVSNTIRIVFGFMFIALLWEFDFAPFMVLIIAILNDGDVATLIAVYATWNFARIEGAGWGWAGVIWLYSLVTYIPLDLLKFLIRYVLSGKAWLNLLENKTAFTTKKDYGKEEREAQWAAAQRTLHGLQPRETNIIFNEKNCYSELSEIAEQAKRRAEVARCVFDDICRLRELSTLTGQVESVVKLRGLDIDAIQQHYTV
ncbi:hypothetical protein F2Q68_00042010, partial [Brassica cretica]